MFKQKQYEALIEEFDSTCGSLIFLQNFEIFENKTSAINDVTVTREEKTYEIENFIEFLYDVCADASFNRDFFDHFLKVVSGYLMKIKETGDINELYSRVTFFTLIQLQFIEIRENIKLKKEIENLREDDIFFDIMKN